MPVSRPSPADAAVHRFVNKTVDFRFRGEDFRFHLSHALFSSFDIDDGTRLLLKSIAQKVDLAALGSVLDVGCGVGVIGACVGRHAPDARVVMQDRDALAVEVARWNCRQNKLDRVSVDCRLAFHGLGGGSFDLVASNIPAKAGAPVLKAFFRHAAGCLSPRGIAAVVIVAPLAATARDAISALGCQVLHTEESNAYSVFHFAAGSAPRETDAAREDLAPYVRASASFFRGQRTCILETAHSLPDFDTLGHDIELALDVLEILPGDRSVLFWNPGQGHLPAAAALSLALPGPALPGPAAPGPAAPGPAAPGPAAPGPAAPPSVAIASRDCLECAITSRNLTRIGVPPASIHCVGSEAEIGGIVPPDSVDLLIAVPHPVPRVPWQADLAGSAMRVLKPGGRLLAVGTSTEIHRLLAQAGKLMPAEGKKRQGFRAVLLKKAP